MIIVNVHIHVKPEMVDAFIDATKINVSNSNQEPGVARFEFYQQKDDPKRFILMEVYRDEAAAASHKQTAHYAVWRDTVVDMMAEPREGVKFDLLAPADVTWR